MAISSGDLFEHLRKLIDSPENIISCEIKLRVDEIPTVTIEQYVDVNTSAESMVKTYELKEIDNESLDQRADING